jgi:hypothetical protein
MRVKKRRSVLRYAAGFRFSLDVIRSLIPLSKKKRVSRVFTMVRRRIGYRSFPVRIHNRGLHNNLPNRRDRMVKELVFSKRFSNFGVVYFAIMPNVQVGNIESDWLLCMRAPSKSRRYVQQLATGFAPLLSLVLDVCLIVGTPDISYSFNK